MSAIHFNSASAFHAKVRLMRPRFFLHPESWAQRSTNVMRCAETHASLAIDALELPLGHRDRALHVFTARAVVGEHVNHHKVGDRSRRLFTDRAEAARRERALGDIAERGGR